MNVLFAGTPDFAVPALQALLKEHTVVGVYTQPDRQSGRGKKITMSPVKQLAQQHDFAIFQPGSLRGQEEIIQQLQPDVFVVVAFGMLLPQSILDIPPLGCINIHGSILPRWRGAAPIQRAIEAGDTETGVSIMQMEIGLDTGPVFQILKTDINAQTTSQMLHDELAQLGAQGICETLSRMEKNLNNFDASIQALKQDDELACYAKKITKSEAQIDWSDSPQLIQQRIRAFIPWPICQTQHQETRIRLWKSSVVALEPSMPSNTPGHIIDIDHSGLTVSCGSSSHALKLETLQRDGSKALASKEFLNGYPMQVGDQLN